MGHVQRIDFFIINKCTNRCVFCSESHRMNGKEVELDEIKKVLILEKNKGAELVQFAGGEPTIHSRFPEILKFAKQLGYRTFIITNGTNLSSEIFCKDAIPFLDEIMFSIHGPTEKIHDAITNNKGSFERLVNGIENVKKYYKGTVKATTCINNINLPYTLDIAGLINKFHIEDYQWMTVVPSGSGRENFYELTPRLFSIERKITEVVDFCDKHSISIRFSGVPMCVLGKNYNLSSDIYEAIKIDNKERHSSIVKLWREPGKYDKKAFKIDMARIKIDKCKWCSKKQFCGGIYQLYYDEYGDSELEPFK